MNSTLITCTTRKRFPTSFLMTTGDEEITAVSSAVEQLASVGQSIPLRSASTTSKPSTVDAISKKLVTAVVRILAKKMLSITVM